MEHGMAVRAYGKKVIHRIDFVTVLNLRYGYDMMHLDESFSDMAIVFLEYKSTYTAISAVMCDAFSARFTVPLVDGYCPASLRTLNIKTWDFFRLRWTEHGSSDSCPLLL